MKINIRKANKSDLSELLKLLYSLFSIEEDFPFEEDRHMAGLNLLLDAEKGAVVFVADLDGEIIGMVTGQIVISTAVGAPSVLLEDLCVSETKRRKGIASLLLDELTLWGKMYGAERIQLVADKTNLTALDFYRKKGFSDSRMIGLYKKIAI